MAFWARKAFGTLEKQAPGRQIIVHFFLVIPTTLVPIQYLDSQHTFCKSNDLELSRNATAVIFA